MLYSGDTGFRRCVGLLTPLWALGIPRAGGAAFSSIQLLSAALGRPWRGGSWFRPMAAPCDPVAEGGIRNRSGPSSPAAPETPPLCAKAT